jgi:hypothetical protein
MSGQQPESDFKFDVRRSVILGHYIHYWGLPAYRYSVKLHDSSRLEVYSFPPPTSQAAFRFATVGASSYHPEAHQDTDWELFLAVPSDLRGADEQQILEMMADVAAYGLFDGVSYRPGVMLPDVPSLPSSWPTRTIVFDRPLCESEQLSPIHLGQQHIDILWVVLAHNAEQDLIRRKGMDAVYESCDKKGWHPTDPSRPSCVDAVG